MRILAGFRPVAATAVLSNGNMGCGPRSGPLERPELAEPDGEAPRRSAARQFLCDDSCQAAGDRRTARHGATVEFWGLCRPMARHRITLDATGRWPRRSAKAWPLPTRTREPRHMRLIARRYACSNLCPSTAERRYPAALSVSCYPHRAFAQNQSPADSSSGDLLATGPSTPCMSWYVAS